MTLGMFIRRSHLVSLFLLEGGALGFRLLADTKQRVVTSANATTSTEQRFHLVAEAVDNKFCCPGATACDGATGHCFYDLTTTTVQGSSTTYLKFEDKFCDVPGTGIFQCTTGVSQSASEAMHFLIQGNSLTMERTEWSSYMDLEYLTDDKLGYAPDGATFSAADEPKVYVTSYTPAEGCVAKTSGLSYFKLLFVYEASTYWCSWGGSHWCYQGADHANIDYCYAGTLRCSSSSTFSTASTFHFGSVVGSNGEKNMDVNYTNRNPTHGTVGATLNGGCKFAGGNQIQCGYDVTSGLAKFAPSINGVTDDVFLTKLYNNNAYHFHGYASGGNYLVRGSTTNSLGEIEFCWLDQ